MIIFWEVRLQVSWSDNVHRLFSNFVTVDHQHSEKYRYYLDSDVCDVVFSDDVIKVMSTAGASSERWATVAIKRCETTNDNFGKLFKTETTFCYCLGKNYTDLNCKTGIIK